MKKSIVSFLAFCITFTITAQNKKLIIGEWLADKVYMNGQLLFNRQDQAAVFAAYKKLAFGDTATVSTLDSLALQETVREASKAFGSMIISFDSKGNHTSSSVDTKTHKTSVAKGVYEFAEGDDKLLFIKMAGGETFEPTNIVELTKTTLSITEPKQNDGEEPMVIVFVRKQKPAPKTKR